MTMNRRNLLLYASATVVAGCSTTTGSSGDASAKRREIDASVDGALTDLYNQASGSRELAAKAKGILVFPKVVSAGFMIGGSYGEGALRKTGMNTAYYKVTAGSVGLLAGAQSKAMYLFFMTQDALQKFESSEGWTVGADASVAVADIGASANIDTRTAQAPIIGFVRSTGGLMANVSIDGTKISKLAL
jgi:lipid-binding SYLF domain-containing protein